MKQSTPETRVERLLGAPLSDDTIRRWPQSGEILRGKARIAEVESHFQGLKLGVTRRHACGDVIVVEWNSDYGDGRVYRNVSIGELRNGKVVRVTDYWGEPFTQPEWRRGLSDSEDIRPHADELTAE
jgi:SnoaL-like domain